MKTLSISALLLVAFLSVAGCGSKTSSAEQITKAEYEQLADGMTVEQVQTIVGGQGEQTSTVNVQDIESVSYQFPGDTATHFAIVNFDNGKLSSKTQTGLK